MKLDWTIDESPDNIHFPYNIVSEKCSQIFFQYIPTEEEAMERYHIIQKQFPRFPRSPENLYKQGEWHGYLVLFWIISAPRKERWQRGNQYYTPYYFRLWIQTHNITSYKWYIEARKGSNDPYLHSTPHRHYGLTWMSIIWKSPNAPYSWEEFKKRIKQYKINKKELYLSYCKTDLYLPTNPWRTYKEHWTNWSDVFESSVAKCLTKRVSLEILILLIRRNKIVTGTQYAKFWSEWHRELNLPSRPQETYSLEKYWYVFPKWQTLGDFIDFANRQTLDIIK
jgi:hypothetical protein